MSSKDEMGFAVLGPSGAGKTTLLACMSEEFEEELPGTVFPAEADTFAVLRRAYASLKAEADNPDKREFERAISATENLRQFLFHIKGRRAVLPVRFYDFPGLWITPGSSGNDTVIDIVKNSAVTIIAVNTPYLMEFDGKYADQGCAVDEIQWVIWNSLMDDPKERLIMFVPIKCERYLDTIKDRSRLSSAVKSSFSKILSLAGEPFYRDKLAMALVPVQTVGNAKFRRFKFSDDERIEREVYRKDIDAGNFCPQNVDQPMRYMMSFLLAQFAAGRKKRSMWDRFWSAMFREGDLKEIAEYIRGGIKTDYDPESGIEIFCGRELIGLPSGR